MILVNPPTGAWLAIKFANLIDPALQTDLFGEKPWLYSPLLCAMNVVNIKPNSTPLPTGSPESSCPSSDIPNASALLCDWEWVGENDLVEDNSLLLPPASPTVSDGFIEDDDSHSAASGELFAADDIAHRRKYFQKKEHRMLPVFKPNQVYNFEVICFFLPKTDICSIY